MTIVIVDHIILIVAVVTVAIIVILTVLLTLAIIVRSYCPYYWFLLVLFL